MLYSGSLVLLSLKIGEVWQEIGGMRNTKMILTQQLIDVSNVAGGNWRELMNQAGLLHININGEGVFLNSQAEKIIQKIAFKAILSEYKLAFASGDYLVGVFQIIHYERFGEVDEEECYAITLANSGRIEYYSVD